MIGASPPFHNHLLSAGSTEDLLFPRPSHGLRQEGIKTGRSFLLFYDLADSLKIVGNQHPSASKRSSVGVDLQQRRKQLKAIQQIAPLNNPRSRSRPVIPVNPPAHTFGIPMGQPHSHSLTPTLSVRTPLVPTLPQHCCSVPV